MRVRWVGWALLMMSAWASGSQAQEQPAPPASASAVRGLIVSPQLQVHKSLGEDEMAVFLVADKMERDTQGKVILSGAAEVRRIDSVVKGDRIEYEQSTGQVEVRGNGLIFREASIVTGPELSYNVDSETGEVQDPNFWLGASGGSGTATHADIFSKNDMRLTKVVYAGCPCPDPSWYIRSSRVDLHFEENEGIARNGVLFFKGVPILASPWLSFPIRKERKSGFLIPTYGMSSNSGFEFSLPYYFNLAPNYDATLAPRYLSKRGLQLEGEFRYLGRNYTGQVNGTYLPRDARTHEQRWLISAQHHHNLGGGFRAMYDVRRVSDDDYFRDFSTFGLNEATTNLLPTRAQLSWSGASYWRSHLQTYTYQTLQDRTGPYRRPPYDKLPELYVRGARYNWGGFDLSSENTATRFVMPKFKYGTHPNPYLAQAPHQSYDGTRFSSYNTISYPIVRAGWYFTPKAGVHLSQYNTDWRGFNAPGLSEPGPRSESRAVPIFSIDTGLTFERETTLFGNDSIQTLEPRIYYLRVPYTDQSTLPVYDTGIATFNFAQAFDENLYSGGWDRIANANQVTLGLTTRWLDASSGFERLSLSAAQRLYFEDQRVTLGNEKPRKGNTSDYLVGATAALTDTLDARFDAQFNPDSNDRNRMSAGLRWRPKRLATLSASYRYERDPRIVRDPDLVLDPQYDNSDEQITLSGQWPLTSKLYALGRFDYSLREKRTTQSILGLEYKGDCCWAARVVLQRYAVSAEDANTAMFFQLELSGLGSLGTDPMGLLRRTIVDYEPVTPPIPEKTTFERYE